MGLHSETNVWNLRSQCHSPQADTKTSSSQQCCAFAQGVCGGVATSLIRTGKFLTQTPSKGSYRSVTPYVNELQLQVKKKTF